MTEKIEHLFLNWNFLDKQDMYDAIEEALAEKDAEIERLNMIIGALKYDLLQMKLLQVQNEKQD